MVGRPNESSNTPRPPSDQRKQQKHIWELRARRKQTFAPRAECLGSLEEQPVARPRSDSRYLWLVGLRRKLDKRKDNWLHEKGGLAWLFKPSLAPMASPGSAGLAPIPPLLPLPQLSRPPGAKSWLLVSIDPGYMGGKQKTNNHWSFVQFGGNRQQNRRLGEHRIGRLEYLSFGYELSSSHDFR